MPRATAFDFSSAQSARSGGSASTPFADTSSFDAGTRTVSSVRSRGSTALSSSSMRERSQTQTELNPLVSPVSTVHTPVLRAASAAAPDLVGSELGPSARSLLLETSATPRGGRTPASVARPLVTPTAVSIKAFMCPACEAEIRGPASEFPKHVEKCFLKKLLEAGGSVAGGSGSSEVLSPSSAQETVVGTPGSLTASITPVSDTHSPSSESIRRLKETKDLVDSLDLRVRIGISESLLRLANNTQQPGPDVRGALYPFSEAEQDLLTVMFRDPESKVELPASVAALVSGSAAPGGKVVDRDAALEPWSPSHHRFEFGPSPMADSGARGFPLAQSPAASGTRSRLFEHVSDAGSIGSSPKSYVGSPHHRESLRLRPYPGGGKSANRAALVGSSPLRPRDSLGLSNRSV